MADGDHVELMTDEWGNELVEYRCDRCGRSGWMAEDIHKSLRDMNARIFCIPCDEPHLFKWQPCGGPGPEGCEICTGQDPERPEHLVPLTRLETRRLETPKTEAERRLLACHSLMRLLKDRHVKLLEQIEWMRNEAAQTLKAIAQAEVELQGLETLVAANSQKHQAARDEDLVRKMAKLARLAERHAKLKQQLVRDGRLTPSQLEAEDD